MFQSTHIQHKLYNWSMVGALNTSRSTGEDNSGEKISEESIGKETGEEPTGEMERITKRRG